ncbi:MAG: multiheme c-type cytochrome [Xanthomonadales bacterium]|nr:multiheme c-type cytochrome [Xanthomonadales bacterium]
MGVATCASSTCHGATQAFRDSNVNQNELSVWQNEDPHANAYKILLDPASEAIASKLGIGPAHEADMCLDCHADNVPESARGEKFTITEGVGCEACHGGAENYLSSHATGSATHAENLEAGLYPTEDPSQRAELCLSCHQGNKNQMITHRIMGAGHPRLQFELDNFTWMHPHFEVDEDYVERKGPYDGAVNWGVGQGVAAITQLETLLDDQAGWNGIFPELVLFDCHACHRSMFKTQWVPRPSTGLGPGVVRYNDASLLMVRHVAAHVDAAAAEAIAQQTRDLHGAMRKGRAETEQAARRLLESVSAMVPRLEDTEFDSSAIRAMFEGLVKDGARGEFRDYAAAEQAALAVDTVLIAFEDNGVISAEEGERLRQEASALYDATRSEDDYRQSEFVAALKKLSAAVP